MKKQLAISLFLILLIVISAIFQPTKLYKDKFKPVDLDTIPHNFGDWIEHDTGGNSFFVDPNSLSLINSIYNQTLSRVYQNKTTGALIMLSVAYGEDQSDSRELHIPDACYPAQGFLINSASDDELVTKFGSVKIRKLVAVKNGRVEPLIYWVVLGGEQVRKGFSSKLQHLNLSLNGYFPDGFIFRVSAISTDVKDTFANEQSFILEMLKEFKPAERSRYVGLHK